MEVAARPLAKKQGCSNPSPVFNPPKNIISIRLHFLYFRLSEFIGFPLDFRPLKSHINHDKIKNQQ